MNRGRGTPGWGERSDEGEITPPPVAVPPAVTMAPPDGAASGNGGKGAVAGVVNTPIEVSSGPAFALPPPPDDLLTLLSDENLEKLRTAYRDGYGRDLLMAFAARQVPYSKAKAWSAFVGDTIYNRPKDENLKPIDEATVVRSSLTPAQRETVVLSVMATTQRDPFAMAGHIYWALMEEMSVAEVADVFMTVGTYAGLDNFRFTSNLLKDVLTMLNAFAEKDAVATLRVAGLFKVAFAGDAVARAKAALEGPPKTPSPPPQ